MTATSFIARAVAIQSQYRLRLDEIASESAATLDEIEGQFQESLELREQAFGPGTASAAGFDALARLLKAHSPVFDHGALTDAAAQIAAGVEAASLAALQEIVQQMNNRVGMARTLRESLICDAVDEREAAMAQLLEETLAPAP